jgi:hypothetical protein
MRMRVRVACLCVGVGGGDASVCEQALRKEEKRTQQDFRKGIEDGMDTEKKGAC